MAGRTTTAPSRHVPEPRCMLSGTCAACCPAATQRQEEEEPRHHDADRAQVRTGLLPCAAAGAYRYNILARTGAWRCNMQQAIRRAAGDMRALAACRRKHNIAPLRAVAVTARNEQPAREAHSGRHACLLGAPHCAGPAAAHIAMLNGRTPHATWRGCMAHRWHCCRAKWDSPSGIG